MTTCERKSTFTTETKGLDRIPESTLEFFRERFRGHLYDLLMSEFLDRSKRGEITKTILAKRINKRPEQITRLLATPGNWTINTISDLALGISNSEVQVNLSNPHDLAPRNHDGEPLLMQYCTPYHTPKKTKGRTPYKSSTNIRWAELNGE